MKGTWQTSGPGFGAILGAAVVVAVAIAVFDFILSVIAWIAVALGVLLVLAAVALAWWLHGRPEREARHAAAYTAAFAPLREPSRVTATVIPQAATGARPAIENHFHVHHHYADGTGPARAPAISGQSGDAITEGK